MIKYPKSILKVDKLKGGKFKNVSSASFAESINVFL